QAKIDLAVNWLLKQSQAGRDGLIYSGHASETSRYMEGHGLATLFLAGACDEGRRRRASFTDDKPGEGRKELAGGIPCAVKYILKAQSSQGGWYHTSKVEGHDLDTLSVTVIQMQALQAAELADFAVPGEVLNHAKKYVKEAIAKREKAAKAGEDFG